jgi:prephenate dehydrogenase
MVVGIIGTGLIGGSLCISLKSRGFCERIIGYDKNQEHLNKALDLGIIDQAVSEEFLLKNADLILLAIPVNLAKKHLPEILNLLSDEQVIIDMGSTKNGICTAVLNHPKRHLYVASHPIAGTENNGPTAAIDYLFDNKITIICEQEKSGKKAIRTALKMYKTLNMRVLYMDSEEHDRHIAYVSHLSHISSFVLGQTVLEIEKDEKNIFNMAGSGFASTVRLAKSSPNMWAPIFEQNAVHLSNALDAYIKNLQEFKNLIDQKETQKLFDLMQKTNEIRRVLDGIDKK